MIKLKVEKILAFDGLTKEKVGMLRRKMNFLSQGVLLRLLVILVGVFFATEVMAQTVSIAAIQTKVAASIGSIASLMQDIALVSGIGFIFASFFKFHQHKMNPTQVPLSQGVALLAVGAGLAVFPHLLGTATEGVFGATVGKVGGTAINTIIK